jgi:hypothetical protein
MDCELFAFCHQLWKYLTFYILICNILLLVIFLLRIPQFDVVDLTAVKVRLDYFSLDNPSILSMWEFHISLSTSPSYTLDLHFFSNSPARMTFAGRHGLLTRWQHWNSKEAKEVILLLSYYNIERTLHRINYVVNVVTKYCIAIL